MDSSRFDQLARSFATATSRRTVIKSLVGAAAAGALSIFTGDSAGARARCRADGTVCSSDGNCCNGHCTPPDFTGRRRCGCVTIADCKHPPVCNVATCSNYKCGAAPDPTQIGSTCGTPASCDSGTNTQRAADTCDAQGRCVPGATTPCGMYVCGGTACLTTCSTDNDCIPGAHCDGDNVCRADHNNGEACDGAGDCLSGFCVDGVCCNSACNGECISCNATGSIGTCTNLTGPACTGGTCVAGSCCPDAQVCGSGSSALCGCGADTCCDEICTELGTKTDCSGCNDACAGGSDCCDGACTPLGTIQDCKSCNDTCTGTDPDCCPSGCADLNSAINNCGSCGNNCSSKGFDFAGCCDGDCFDLFNDINHCGACDAATCTGTTPDCCAGTCKDLATDLDNCGTCFSQCRASNFQHATAVTCTGGGCQITACEATYTLIGNICCASANVCGTGPSATCCAFSESCCSGVCADTSLSTANCGGCGIACPNGVSCAGGVCSQGSFGETCTSEVPCSYTNSSTGNSCLNGRCCIPSGVSCTVEQITFSGQCCSNTALSCPSVGTCP